MCVPKLKAFCVRFCSPLSLLAVSEKNNARLVPPFTQIISFVEPLRWFFEHNSEQCGVNWVSTGGISPPPLPPRRLSLSLVVVPVFHFSHISSRQWESVEDTFDAHFSLSSSPAGCASNEALLYPVFIERFQENEMRRRVYFYKVDSSSERTKKGGREENTKKNLTEIHKVFYFILFGVLLFHFNFLV